MTHVQLVHEVEPLKCIVITGVTGTLSAVFSATREVREKDLEGEGTISELQENVAGEVGWCETLIACSLTRC